ncbi:hypothetical protein [Desulfofarcimen acetoxidans]|uniref:hypothetical protein n=1 Tax=Desulfofarcimen acetoxidans TaxID=58138 RepID=UPI00019E59D5|nr:hypothetical protein [Desulfofarcimen acetoxidans]
MTKTLAITIAIILVSADLYFAITPIPKREKILILIILGGVSALFFLYKCIF